MKKKYVIEAAKSFAKVIRNHPEKNFDIYFIGDSIEKKYKRIIESVFIKLKNCRINMTGAIYPIPYGLLDHMDLFVSSAGSARVSYSIDKPTISVDGNDGKAIGVLGYTTLRSLFREDEAAIEIDNLIEKVLFSDFLKNLSYTKADNSKMELSILSEHLDFLNRSVSEKKYYNIIRMKPAGKDKIKKYIISIIGIKAYSKIKPIFVKFNLLNNSP